MVVQYFFELEIFSKAIHIKINQNQNMLRCKLESENNKLFLQNEKVSEVINFVQSL